MRIKEMKEICKPLGIHVDCRWSDGFQVAAKDERAIKDGLRPLGFKVRGIGIGRDYNRKCVILYAVKGDKVNKMLTNVTVEVNTDLLRKQIDSLLHAYSKERNETSRSHLLGLLNMCEAILDKAEVGTVI